MSNQIPTSFVDQFSANVFHLSQQKGSRLQGAVRNETQQAESAFWDRIGSVAAVKRTGRHQDTPQLDTPHSRRRVTLEDYLYSDLIDNPDKYRALNDPANDYAQAAVWALGRAKDDEIIAAALGNAFGGQKGGTAVPLPNSQKLAASDGATPAGVNLNVRTLRKLKKKFDENEVDPSIRRYILVSASQIESLLAEQEITSSDFNTIRALVAGEVNQFMGFDFLRIERLPQASAATTFDLADHSVGAGAGSLPAATSRRCIAWAEDGLLLSTAQEIRARMDERADKAYSMQVFAELGVGATRMEEEKVVEVIVNEA